MCVLYGKCFTKYGNIILAMDVQDELKLTPATQFHVANNNMCSVSVYRPIGMNLVT